MSARPSDETLLAYADGQLPPDDRAAVEAYLAQHGEERAFVTALQRSGVLARQAFDQPMQEPPPARLVDAILNAPAPDNVVGLRPRARTNPDARSAWRVPWSLPVAACLALIIGAGLGFVAGRQGSGPGTGSAVAIGPLDAGSTLARLLETEPSGARMPAGPSQQLVVAATFRDRQARPCREVEVIAAGTTDLPVALGIACRAVDGRWIVEGAVQLATADADGRYRPAGSSERDALEGLLTILGAGQAMNAAEERRLIGRGWRAE